MGTAMLHPQIEAVPTRIKIGKTSTIGATIFLRVWLSILCRFALLPGLYRSYISEPYVLAGIDLVVVTGMVMIAFLQGI